MPEAELDPPGPAYGYSAGGTNGARRAGFPDDEPVAPCPADVVDRLLWRNAQRILDRHVAGPDGTCRLCRRTTPCSPRIYAQRADEVARMPAASVTPAILEEITRLVPALVYDYDPKTNAADRRFGTFEQRVAARRQARRQNALAATSPPGDSTDFHTEAT